MTPAEEIDEAYIAMNRAGARAVGMLSSMVSTGTIPGVHRDRAVEIVAQFDTAAAWATEIAKRSEAA